MGQLGQPSQVLTWGKRGGENGCCWSLTITPPTVALNRSRACCCTWQLPWVPNCVVMPLIPKTPQKRDAHDNWSSSSFQHVLWKSLQFALFFLKYDLRQSTAYFLSLKETVSIEGKHTQINQLLKWSSGKGKKHCPLMPPVHPTLTC